MTEKLKSNVFKSVKWTALVTLLNTMIQPIYRILLALLLLPTEFGYIAVITLIVSFADLLNNIGIGEAIIQKDEVTTEDLSTLFFFNTITTLIISSLIYFSSSYIEIFYSMSGLTEIIKVTTLIVFVNGITSIFKFYLHRYFHFKETSILKIIKMLAEVAIAITLILLDLGIWGFVFALVTANILHSSLLVMVAFKKTDLRINFYFSILKLKNFLSFGIFVSSKKIINFFSQRADEIIIGGVLSAEILGIYYLAKNLLFQIQSLITTSFGQILLPMFSKMKDNIEKQKEIYLTILRTLLFIGTPIFMLIIISADIFVPLVFGQEWIESALVFRWLSIPVFCLLLSSGVSTSLMYSQNKTVTLLLIDIMLVPIYILVLYLFNHGDLLNILFIYSCYVIFKFIIVQVLISKIFKIKIKEFTNLLKVPMMSAIITGSLLIIILIYYSYDIGYISLFLFYLFGSILYLVICWSIRKDEIKIFIQVLKGLKN